jgi:tyrosine-protein phosphatase SIW14
MLTRRQALLACGFMLALAGWSFYFFRATYEHGRRLRVVVPGRFYRSGQLTSQGFADVVRQLGIRTIINVQDDYPDPRLRRGTLVPGYVREKELCERLGVRYVWIAPDTVLPSQADRQRPLAIDQFLQVMDQPDVYPVLLHCKAGLHRTGLLTAIYRMEYQGWSRLSALHELREHGFGDWVCTRANWYVDQYVGRYVPRRDRSALAAAGLSD